VNLIEEFLKLHSLTPSSHHLASILLKEPLKQIELAKRLRVPRTTVATRLGRLYNEMGLENTHVELQFRYAKFLEGRLKDA
jgi:DNA-binding MarR family transcriptional regulator